MPYFMHELEIVEEDANPCPMRNASKRNVPEVLDSLLPGFRRGRMQSLSKGLHNSAKGKRIRYIEDSVDIACT
jgi:hypothetical protein